MPDWISEIQTTPFFATQDRASRLCAAVLVAGWGGPRPVLWHGVFLRHTPKDVKKRQIEAAWFKKYHTYHDRVLGRPDRISFAPILDTWAPSYTGQESPLIAVKVVVIAGRSAYISAGFTIVDDRNIPGPFATASHRPSTASPWLL